MNKLNPIIDEFEECYLFAYADDGGIATIGRGTTHYINGKPVEMGDEITEDKADAYYFHDIKKIYKKCKFPKWLGVNQKIALESLVYNVGISAYNKSKLKIAIDNKDLKEIYKQWDWIYINKTPARGLARRRALELYYFMKDKI